MQTTDRSNLEALVGEPLTNPALDAINWTNHYPLSLNHRTVNGVIAVDELNADDAIILDQYVQRGFADWRPLRSTNIEALAFELEAAAGSSPTNWDSLIWDRLFTDGPLQQINGYPTVASCVLALTDHQQFRDFVDEIATDDGVTPIDVLRSIARTIHAALDAD